MKRRKKIEEMKNMKTKIIATIMALGMVLTAFSLFATAGTPESILSRVAPNADGTRADTGANAPNGITYMWEQAEPFVLTTSVATWGTNTKGIVVDGVGTWNYNVAWTQGMGDAGSIWDAWTTGEDFVQIYEVFNDQSTTGRNYTQIYEDQMEGDGSTNAGGGATPVAPNILTPINDPTLVSAVPPTAIIQVAAQTNGMEVPALFDGYGVYKSTTGAITQTNQGTYLGDATFGGGVWTYTDNAFSADSWYAVKVKWDGGTAPFIAPRYSYGMSNDLFVPGAPPANINAVVTGFAAEVGPLLAGNHNNQQVTVQATVSDAANEGNLIVGAEANFEGTWYPMTAVDGAFDEVTEDVTCTWTLTAPTSWGYPTGAHNYQVRAWDNGAPQGPITPASNSFTIVDTTIPDVAWTGQPAATLYTTQPANFIIGYEDFTAFNPAVTNSYVRWRVNAGPYNNYVLFNSSFSWATYNNILTYSIPGSTFVAGDVVDYLGQVTDGNGNIGLLGAGSFTVADAPPGVQDPYPIYGYLYLYDGAAGVYSPNPSAGGATVTATWISSFNGATLTRTDLTNGLGQFSIDLMNYTDGAQVWLTAPFDAPYNNMGYNYTTINIAGFPGGRMQNVLCGIPYNVEITVPIAGANEQQGVAFGTTYVWYDINGLVCQGYYTFVSGTNGGPMTWWSNDPLFVPPVGYAFNGVADAGTHNDLLTLFTGPAPWINISERGAAGVDPYSTPWGALNLIPTTFVGGNVVLANGWLKDWDNITLQMAVGGFDWKVVNGWNIVSVPQDPVNKGTNAVFDSFDALNYVAWQLTGGFTELSLADRTGGNPSTYNMFDYGMAEGVSFPMDGVHGYWVYADLVAAGPFVCHFNSTNYSAGFNVLNAVIGWNLVGFTHNYIAWGAMPTAAQWTTAAIDPDLATVGKIVVTEWLEDAAPQWYNSYVDMAGFPGMATHNWVWDNGYSAYPANGLFLWLEAPAQINFNVAF